MIKVMYNTFKDTTVGTLKLFFDATHVIEKLCWLLIGILGTIVMAFVVVDQIQSWRLNPIMSSRKWIPLSEVDFPAITFCHRGNTRLEFAERMMKAADQKDPKMRKLRSIFLKKSVELLTMTMTNTYKQNSRDIFEMYSFYCTESSSGSLWGELLKYNKAKRTITWYLT